MPPRYGRPPGFGGAYDGPTRGRFQPGSEVGVVDPNEGRYWSKAVNPAMTTNASTSAASMGTHAARSAVHHYPERGANG